MSIPADFRRVIEADDPDWAPGLPTHARLIYGDHLKNRLEVVTLRGFNKLMQTSAAMEPGEKQRWFNQYMIVQSEPLKIDKDGRIILSQRLREKLDVIEGDLMLRGTVDQFEIWNADAYRAKYSRASEEFLADKGEDFDPRTLAL